MNIALGMIGFASNTGLGVQTQEFYNHMNPDKVLLVDLSKLNGMPIYPDRYQGNVRKTNGIPNRMDVEWLAQGVDAIFVCETPLNYALYKRANELGVVVIQQLNYEFFDYFRSPNLPKPTMFAMPSTWGFDRVSKIGRTTSWPVPVNRDGLPFREIRKCKTFVHILGRPAAHDRNGTLSFIEASKALGDKFSYKIYLQLPTDTRANEYFEPVRKELETIRHLPNYEIIVNVPNYHDLYASGDVLVLPRRYGGLCLPMQEALSVGMPVIMTDLVPNYDVLPKSWLVSARHKGDFMAHTKIDIFEAEISLLVNKMGEFANDEFMRWSNEKANEIAETLSWNALAPVYRRKIKKLISEKN